MILTSLSIKLIALPLLTALGSFLYRFRGGGFGNNGPRPLSQILFSSFPCIFLPLLPIIAAYNIVGFTWLFLPWIIGYLLSVIWSVAWECTGHGNFQDLGHDPTEGDEEVIEPLIYWLHGKIPAYWYDALGLALTGLVVTISAGLFVAICGNVTGGILLALSGLLKTPAYMIGWKWFKGAPTGEWLTGAFRWFAAAVIWILFF